MQGTDDDTALALCMLDVQSYRHILRIWNTSFFSTAEMVWLMRLNVTLYLLCLSCHVIIHVDFGKAYRSGTLLFYRITRPLCYVNADKALVLFLTVRSFRSPVPSLARNEICRKAVVSSKEAGIIWTDMDWYAHTAVVRQQDICNILPVCC